MKERQIIDVDDLVVDEENPRFEAVSTEDDALFSILKDQSLASGNKILNLARDIVEHGLNVSELLVVTPIGGAKTFLVREGNRRVTAIKLSLHTDRIPSGFNNLAPLFAELSDAMQSHRNIECYVCDDEEEIRRLLMLRHGGESGGVGTVKWNSAQTARFSQEGNSQSARALSLIDHLRDQYGQGELWHVAAAIPATNLGRLISTPEVRQMLGIKVDGSVACYLGGHDALLLDVLKAVREGGVGPIYSKEARVQLVESAAERVELDSLSRIRLPLDMASDVDRGETQEDNSNSSIGTDAEEPGPNASVSNKSTLPNVFNEAYLPVVAENTSERQADTNSSGETVSGGCKSGVMSAGGTIRRKPVTRSADKRMFGHTLRPKGPKSNDIYRGIDWIDGQYVRRPEEFAYLLPILGFSLRLLMEIVAREYYESLGEDCGDQSLTKFLKDVAKPAVAAKLSVVGRNNLALASEWIDGKYAFEAFFAKWAHGTLAVDRSALVRQSELVALIIDEVWT